MALVLLLACGTERRPSEAPFVTCPAGTLLYEDGSWAGSSTMLMAPPDTFSRELAGDEVRVSLSYGGEVAAFNAVVRDDGSLFVLVNAPETEIRERPLRVEIGGAVHVVYPAAESAPATLHNSPAILEDPDDVMSFGATLTHPLELGAFYNATTTELREIEPGDVIAQGQLKGHEGHTAIVGLRTVTGEELCVRTPCGCSEALRELGLCGPPPVVMPTPTPTPGDEPI